MNGYYPRKENLPHYAGALFCVFLFDLLMKYQNLFQFHFREGFTSNNLFLASTLLLAQRETILIAAVALLPILYWKKSRFFRSLVLLSILFHHFYLIINRLFYQFFFVNYQRGIVEGQDTKMSLLFGSIVESFSVLMVGNCLIAVLSVYALARLWHPKKKSTLTPRFAYSLAVLFFALLLWPPSNEKYFNLCSYALADVVRGALHQSPLQLYTEEDPKLDIDTPVFGSPPSGLEETVRSSVTFPTKKKNLVLIILESVGSSQYLEGGRINQKISPRLAAMNAHAIVFPHLYAPFPGTVRSHLSLQTAGKLFTWGSVFELLDYPIETATFPSTLKSLGYRTALFSAQDLDGENMLSMYKHLPFDDRYYPEGLPTADKDKARLNSWGVKEPAVIRESIRWIEKSKGPFFLEFHSSATHHPYSFEGEAQGISTDKDRYHEAIRYTDNALGALLEHLKKTGKLKDTVIAITGDHGEAFGEFHATNYAHKNHIYEENIKTFLVLIDPDMKSGPLSSELIGSNGNILPTITHYLTREEKPFAEQSLFTAEFKPRIQYFHKNAHPERWGLRDGRWKYIATKEIPKQFELYDLHKDPNEQRNISSDHPLKLREYEKRVAHWYIRKNTDFLKTAIRYDRNLANIDITDLQTPGPKTVLFGTEVDGKFRELRAIHPREKMTAWTQMVAYPKNTPLVFDFISPTGKKHPVDITADPEWTTMWVYLKTGQPLEEGKWRVTIRHEKRKLLKGEFLVDSKASLIQPER